MKLSSLKEIKQGKQTKILTECFVSWWVSCSALKPFCEVVLQRHSPSHPQCPQNSAQLRLRQDVLDPL